MSGLIPILAILFILNAATSGSRKKKKQQAAQKSNAQQAAAQPKQKPKPVPRQPRKGVQQRIPFTKEEWKAYLNELGEEVAPKVTAPLAYDEDHIAGEGFISTQGESIEEHAEHRRKIAEEEARFHEERAALSDLRNANLEKLRTAVVMSEVLGKPVALRPRTGYHR